MKAAVDASHALGKRIAIHSYGPDGARDAVRARNGFARARHRYGRLDDRRNGCAAKTFYVPTIDHNRYYADNYRKLNYPPRAVDDLNDFIRRNLETARKAFRAGVRFAMGSDAVYTHVRREHSRVGVVRQSRDDSRAGLEDRPTTNGAELLGMEQSLGAIRPGYLADIVAVEGNPLDDIQVAIHKVRWVMKSGAVVVDKTK